MLASIRSAPFGVNLGGFYENKGFRKKVAPFWDVLVCLISTLCFKNTPMASCSSTSKTLQKHHLARNKRRIRSERGSLQTVDQMTTTRSPKYTTTAKHTTETSQKKRTLVWRSWSPTTNNIQQQIYVFHCFFLYKHHLEAEAHGDVNPVGLPFEQPAFVCHLSDVLCSARIFLRAWALGGSRN